jgi:hypothetical protein
MRESRSVASSLNILPSQNRVTVFNSVQYCKLLQLRSCVSLPHASTDWWRDYNTPDSSTYCKQLLFPIRDSRSINHCPQTEKWLSSKCGWGIRESNLSADNQGAKVLFPYPELLMKRFQAFKKLYPTRHTDGKGNVAETFHSAVRLV